MAGLQPEKNISMVTMPSDLELRESPVAIIDIGIWRKSMCRLCLGTGEYPGYAPGSASEVVIWECDCEAHLTRERWLTVRGVPRTLQRLRWTDMIAQNQKSRAWANIFRSTAGWNVRSGIGGVIVGTPSVGKTAT